MWRDPETGSMLGAFLSWPVAEAEESIAAAPVTEGAVPEAEAGVTGSPVRSITVLWRTVMSGCVMSC